MAKRRRRQWLLSPVAGGQAPAMSDADGGRPRKAIHRDHPLVKRRPLATECHFMSSGRRASAPVSERLVSTGDRGRAWRDITLLLTASIIPRRGPCSPSRSTALPSSSTLPHVSIVASQRGIPLGRCRHHRLRHLPRGEVVPPPLPALLKLIP